MTLTQSLNLLISLNTQQVYLKVHQSIILDWKVGDIESFSLQNPT